MNTPAAIERDLVRSAKTLKSLRNKEREQWEAHKELLKLGSTEGLTCVRMADLTEVSKARVWQIVTDFRK